MRSYKTTHPWITFEATDVNRVTPAEWMLLGEARSKCEHLAGVPLKPAVAQRLYIVTLVKGAVGTTAIEGNTLTEDQVLGIIEGSYKAPPSRQYQEQEVRNVIDALGHLSSRIVDGENIELSAALIRSFNREVLEGLSLEGAVIPGEIRRHSVTVGPYRGAPPEDCDYLLHRLVDWLNSDLFRSSDPQIQFALMLAKAVYAHLYLAWIHPFGDGNGRTARLVEFLLLANCGVVPMPAAHLLSNHYNLTRDRYYRELARASESGGDTLGFLTYAIEGFIDGIREVIGMVREQQVNIAWNNYIHEKFSGEPNTKASDRQRALVLAMPIGESVARQHLQLLTAEIALMYANAGPRVLARDLNHLVALGLLERDGRSYRARSDQILAFLPPIASTDMINVAGECEEEPQLKLAI